MTVYRVGEAGATVFDESGGVVARLAPGLVVVEGTVDLAGSFAARHAEHVLRRKRIRAYADKQVTASRDYSDKDAG